ncbi:MAG TPA: c-type cytochrome [Opitutaceae bacterium]|nr:c-type cytochrome [Opitutaceae bacterium]
MRLPLPHIRPWLTAVPAGALLLAWPCAGRAADGPALFADNCASCHGADGKARTPAGRKVHAKDLSLSQLTDEGIVRQIREGFRDSHGQPAMPPFKERLSDEEIKALVPMVKSFRK